jgi:hypothetical protein
MRVLHRILWCLFSRHPHLADHFNGRRRTFTLPASSYGRSELMVGRSWSNRPRSPHARARQTLWTDGHAASDGRTDKINRWAIHSRSRYAHHIIRAWAYLVPLSRLRRGVRGEVCGMRMMVTWSVGQSLWSVSRSVMVKPPSITPCPRPPNPSLSSVTPYRPSVGSSVFENGKKKLRKQTETNHKAGIYLKQLTSGQNRINYS